MEIEDQEQEILLEPEYFAGVLSVNGKTGNVVLTTSDLENDSGYQTSEEVEAAITDAVGDAVLTVQKNGSAVGTFSANAKENSTINIIVPTTTSELTNDANFQNANDVSTAISNHNQSSSSHQDIRQAIIDEAAIRLNADNGLQGQIDAITSSSDVVDIVGTYADLQAYDTQHLQNNDVIKVLQDETHNEAMTYYRWNKTTETWTYIGSEGPYYTKSETNTLLTAKLDADEVPDGFFDGPATITSEGTNFELSDVIKFKDVSLLGNSEQNSYTGKNLWNPTPYKTNRVISVTGAEVTLAGAAIWEYDSVVASQEYTLSLTATTNDGTLRVHSYDSGGHWLEQITYKSIAVDESTTIQFTTPNNIGILRWSFYSNITEAQLESGSQATAYEPYVGGIPAPSPDYPQTVNVVTGSQTITIGDNDTQTQTYTVDLGSIELCKIGNYQDYIYKSGDDWYIHKETGKYTFDGNETITYRAVDNGFIISASTVPTYFVGIADSPLIGFSTHFKVESTTSTWTGDNTIGLNSSNVFWCQATSFATSQQDCLTWLATNTPTVYYTLATATDTKITDSSLVAQLNNLYNATMYSPKTYVSTSGSLPVILNVEAFTDNLNSLLEIAAEPEPEQITYTDFVGTDGVNAGAAGLVPAPATTDVDKYLKSDGTWATVGGGGGGSITELTSADYNYHLGGDTDDGVALWQLASGVYSCKDNVKIYYDNNGNNSTQASVYIVNHENNYPSAIQYCWASVQGDAAAGHIYGYSDNSGTLLGGARKVGAVVDMIYADGVTKQRVAIGSSASSTKTDAIAIGTGAKAQGSNGSTAVGKNTTATGNYSTAIGVGGNVTRTYSIGIGGAVTTSNVTGAVALGYGSAATRTGEVNIGSASTAQGFNSTNYRVIGGVHDGQLAQDVATVNQVNATIDAINTALSINIPHIGA